jgi:pantoate--beta-alanine ligase
LRAAGRLYAAGERDAHLLVDTARTRLAVDPDYLEVRRRDDLGAYDADRPAILLVAARLGATRIIDNLSLEAA